MKTHFTHSTFTGSHTFFSKLVLVTALGFYAGTNVYAEDNQDAQASAVRVAMVAVEDSSKNTAEKRKSYFEEKSSTYVSKLVCE